MANHRSAVQISVRENGTFVSIPTAEIMAVPMPMTFIFGQFESGVRVTLENPTPAEARVASPPQRREARARRADINRERALVSQAVKENKGKAPMVQPKRKADMSPRSENGERVSVFSRLTYETDMAHYKKIMKQKAQMRKEEQQEEIGWETVSSKDKLGRRARRNRNKRAFSQGESSGIKEASLLSQNPFHPLTIKNDGNGCIGGKASLTQVASKKSGVVKPHVSKGHRQEQMHVAGFDWNRLGTRIHKTTGNLQQLGKNTRRSMKWVVKARNAQCTTDKGKALQ